MAPPQQVAEALRSLLKGLAKTSGDTQARTLYAFRGAQLHHQRRVVNADPVLHDFEFRGRTVRAFHEIGRLTDAPIRIRTSRVPNEHEVAVSLEQATLLEMLDSVAAAAGVSWSMDRYGVVRVSPEPGRGGPRSYAGPTRVRMSSLSCQRSTDFAGSDSAAVRFGLDVDFAWPIRPMVPPTMQMRSLSVDGAEVPVITEVSEGDAFRCSAESLPPSADRIERIAGELACAFNSGFKEVALDEPAEGTTVSTKSFDLQVDRVYDDGYLLTLAATGVGGEQLTQGMLRCAVSTTILGIDEGGVEALAKVRVLQAVSPNQKRKQIRMRLAFLRDRFRRPKHLRLRLAEGILLELYPVRFYDVALP